MKNSAHFFKSFLRLFSITFFLSLLFTPSVSAYTPDYFGVTSADFRGANLQENQDMLTALGMKDSYTWDGSSVWPSGSNNTQLVMLRLGHNRWVSQGFYPHSPTEANNSTFTVDGYPYKYNRKAIEDRVVALKGIIANQPVRYYVIGNEINNDHPDGDGGVPSTSITNKQLFQAYQFKAIYDAIMLKDPDAVIVAPSVTGFDPDMNNGKSWYDTFITQYQNTFGALPIDVLNHHAYDTVIYKKGTTNRNISVDANGNINEAYQRRADAQVVIDELKAFRTWANNKGWSHLPIFITEFGTLNCEYTNGQPKYCWNIDDNPNNDNPDESTNSTITTTYLNKLINGFKRYQNDLKLQRWFIFGQADQMRDYYAPFGPNDKDTLVQNPTVLGVFNDTTYLFEDLTTVGTWYKNKSLEQTFADVPSSHVHYAKIEADYNKGFIDHCGTPSDIGIMNFCPNDGTTRAIMARWLMKAKNLTPYFPSTASFSDVIAPPNQNAHPDYGWIERTKQQGITNGCGNGQYCPNSTVLRQEMAKFITLAKGWSTYTPPQNYFTDVTDSNHWAYGYIYRMKQENVTNGCQASPLKYCPLDGIARADMGAFLFNAGF